MLSSNTLWVKHIIRKVFLEDWVMKLVALAITLALWLGVTGLSTPTTQQITSVPFSIRYSNHIEVTNSPILEVTLVVTGDRRRLAQIEKLAASMDISDVPPGDKVIPLTPETVSVFGLPTGVKLDEIQPRSVAVRIEAVEEKEVAVNPETYGEIPDGYEIYSETVTPPKVGVRGPAGFVRSLESVSTERIDLTGRTGDFVVKQVTVAVSNPKATLVSTTVVDVAIRIGESRIERTYSVSSADGRRVRAVLFGGRSLFENFAAADLKVSVSKNNSGDDVPQLILPAALDGKLEVRSARFVP